MDADLARAEQELTVAGKPAPQAYVFITNRGFMHALDSERWNEVGLACGFKIDDFASRTPRTILELVRAREKHKELHWLRKAVQRHNAIPNTFDDRLPEEGDMLEGDMPRLLIGATYLVPDGSGGESPGVLMDAAVNEPRKEMYGTYRLGNGAHVMCTSPLTEGELAAYRRSPDTFFGIMKEVKGEIQEPLDCYDFFWATYSQSTREKLLEFVSNWPDYASLSKLDQKELAQHYCARMAEMMWTTTAGGRVGPRHRRVADTQSSRSSQT